MHNPHTLTIGHYVYDSETRELDGPHETDERAAHVAQSDVDYYRSDPRTISIIHIAAVTVLPETLPNHGE